MEKISVAAAETLSAGSIIIPNIIFAGLITYYGDLRYILPFVLMYSFQKAGVFLIQGFGKVNNPYKPLIYGLFMSVAGTLLCLFFTDILYVFDIGAVLVGAGMSNYSALFKTIKDKRTALGQWHYKKATAFGYLALLVLMLFISAYNLKIRGPEPVIFLIFLGLQVSAFYIIFKVRREDSQGFDKTFLKREHTLRYFVPGILILVVTFYVRLLKQTADSHLLIFVATSFCVILVIGMFYSNLGLSNYSYQSVWFGAVRNYIVIFSLISFIATGRGYMVGLTYFTTILGLMVGLKTAKKMATKYRPYIYNKISIYATLLSSLLLFNFYTYMAGVFLSYVFLTMGNGINIKYFTTRESIPQLERRIVISKLNSFGAIIQQIILLSLIVIISHYLYSNGSIALEAYEFHNGDMKLQNIFLYTKIICIVIMCVSGLIIAGNIKDRDKEKA